MKTYTLMFFLLFSIFVFLKCNDNVPTNLYEPQPLKATILALENEFQNQNFNYNKTTDQFNYPIKIKTIYTPEDATLDELGNVVYKDLKVFDDNYNLGGIKLCYEISAEISGIENANKIYAGQKLTFFSIGALGFKIIDLTNQSNNVVSRMINKDITFISGKVK